MKVLHICDSFSPLSETFIYDYITELERKGIDNHVLTFKRINEEDRPFEKVHVAKIKKDFVWCILRVSAEFNKKPNKFWAMQRREIKRIVKIIKPDIIHAHFGPMGVLVAKLANKNKIPLIISFHGYDASALLKSNYWINEYKFFNNDGIFITVVSDYMKERLSRFIKKEKINVIHVGKNLVDYKFIDINENKDYGIRKFLSIGRLIEKKGFTDLIEAFDLVVQKYSDIQLIIIGDGPLKDDLERLIENKNLRKHIKLLGSMFHKEVLNYYKISDAFVLTSKTAKDGDMEGIPTVLMEAQAFGLPVISTKHSGIPEVIPQENHQFLAEEGNIEQIKNCIIKLINTDNTELIKIVERGRKKVEEEFNLESEVKKLIELYNEALKNETKQ